MTDDPNSVRSVEHSARPDFRAVVFDMDGLLLNTEHLYDVVLGAMLDERGHQFTLEAKLEMIGTPEDTAFTLLIERYALTESIESLARELKDRFASILPEQLRLMPGVLPLLARVSACRLPVSIATSSQRDFATDALRRVGILDKFDFLLCGNEVEQGKPHPDIYLESAKRHDVTPQCLLVFEDSHNGSLSASRASTFTVAVPGEHSVAQDFSHANLVVPTLEAPEVFDLLPIPED